MSTQLDEYLEAEIQSLLTDGRIAELGITVHRREHQLVLGGEVESPHRRDEIYVVAAGSGFYRIDGTVTAVGPGDMCFAAAHAPHGFEDFTDDFAIWVIFYGTVK